MAAITFTPDRSFRPAPRRRPVPSGVYLRRRLAAVALVLGILLAGSWVLGALGGGSLTASEAGSGSATLTLEPVARSTYVVAPGDTLWSIARRFAPEGDVRPVVDALAAHRNGRPLQVGERLELPLGVTP